MKNEEPGDKTQSSGDDEQHAVVGKREVNGGHGERFKLIAIGKVAAEETRENAADTDDDGVDGDVGGAGGAFIAGVVFGFVGGRSV